MIRHGETWLVGECYDIVYDDNTTLMFNHTGDVMMVKNGGIVYARRHVGMIANEYAKKSGCSLIRSDDAVDHGFELVADGRVICPKLTKCARRNP